MEEGAVVKKKPKFWKKAGIVLGFSAWVMIAFLGVQLMVGSIFQLMKAAGASFDGINEVAFSGAVGAIIYSLTILVALGVPHLLGMSATKKELGFSRFLQWKDYVWLGGGVVTYFTLTIVITAISMVLLPFIDFDQKQVTGYETVTHSYEYILAFLGLVVIAPIAEEILFRGFLLGKLRSHGVKNWIAIIVVSLLFAVAHFQGNVGIDVFALSIILCLLRIFSGSLWAPILLHMTKNGIAYYFLFINPSILSTLGG